MKLCDTCIYQNNVEQLKPCIIYRDDCEFYEKERGDMTREEAIANLKELLECNYVDSFEDAENEALEIAIKALEQEPKTGWNNHQIACMLADLFGDACACNYNGIDEWLGELCDFKDTCCPNPVGVACWEQFLKYSQSRYTECGYEVRDKNALQESKIDVLDKIRAEIMSKDGLEEALEIIEEALEIIDKYKAESEDEE